MKTILPKKLKPGDKIGIISPSSLVTSVDELEKGMDTLRQMGLIPVLSQHALESRFNFQAGTPAERLDDLHSMFSNPEISCIACTTGGYSGVELLPRRTQSPPFKGIDWDLIKKNPKIFIGYSDITSILIPIHEKTGLVTFHGPLIEGFNRIYTRGGQYTFKNMKQMLMDGRPRRFDSYSEWKVLKSGIADGKLVGGNLNILLSLVGTPYEPKWEKRILFWEDVDETIEGFNNYLIRMNLSGIFKKISGLVIGKITNLQSIDDNEDIKENRNSPTIEDIILNATSGFDFPILYNVDFGHDMPSLTIPIGLNAQINCPEVGKVGYFFLSERCVSE